MTIANVALSNTFNEFRATTNSIITEVNKLSDGTANLIIDTITANQFIGVSSDLSISANTGTDVVSLVTESLRIVGTNGISTSIASSSNTVNVNLDTSGVTAGTYGSASQVPTLVIDAQGRVTSAANVNVAGVSAFNYHSSNANFQIATADGGSFTASIGQDLGTSANVTFQHLIVSGNLTVTGTTTTISANSLAITDNLIYLNNDSSNTNVDLGFAGNYNDGVYRHAGLFRDADDGIWKFFDSYTPEPDASANLDTSHVSFTFAALKAGDVTSNGIFYGNGSGLTTLNASNVTSGTLAVSTGGTGLNSGNSGSLLYFSGTTTIASSNVLDSNEIIVGGGAGVAPRTSNTLTLTSAVTSAKSYIRASAFAETLVALGNTGTAINLDIVDGGVFTATLTGNATITLRYPVATGVSSFTLILTNDATAGRSVAWSGGTFIWPNGAASLNRTTAANAIDIWTFFTPDGGTTYYGNIAMRNMSA